MERFYTILKDIRKENGYAQQQIADILGIIKKNKIKLFIFFALIFCANSIFSQNFPPSKKPTLAVMIAIDGLQSEHLATLWDGFESGGFKRAVNSGFFTPNGLFNYVSTSYVSDYASIFTGTTPSNHGIVSDKIYSLLDDDLISIVADGKFYGLSTNVGRSPKNLMTTTIADALKFANSQSKAFSIGLTPEAAILMGGHSADGAVWIDDEGFIGSSDFYKKMPFWADRINIVGMSSSYLQAKWRPKAALYTYLFPPFFITSDNYFYLPDSKKTSDLVKNFRQIPSANSLIKDMAVNALRNENLGKDNNPDLLCINFTLMPVNQNFAELNSAEKEDIYLNLDRDLYDLFNQIEQNVGLANTLIVITGTQTEKYSAKTLSSSNLSVGKFDGKRSMALLNSFLMAKYGQGRWILSYNAKQITINQSLIKEKKVNTEEIKSEICNFLKELQGVKFAFPSDELYKISGEKNDMLIRLKNSLFPNRSGDITLVLKEGWQDTNIDLEPSLITSVSPNYAPVMIFGMNIAAKKEQKNIDIIDIAPTICRLLQIPLPNGCTGVFFDW